MTLIGGAVGAAAAKVVSAAALTEQQISALRKLLEKKLEKRVEVSLEIDASLIGGFYIYIDGYIIDRTVKKQIRDMKESIMRGLI